MGKIKKEEKKAGGFWYLVRNLNKKHRVSIRDQHDDTEVGYMYISTWRVAGAFLGLFIVLAAVVAALVVYTPVLDRLPGNPGQRSRDMLAGSILKLDSLENELRVMMLYGENVRLIMEGKTPVIRTMKSRQADSLNGKDAVVPSEADSLLRRQLESLDGRYALVHDGEHGTPGATRMEFVAPVSGEVAVPFNPPAGMNGVGVSFAESRQIVAAAPGTVIMSVWTPEDDNIIQIQHRNNYITTYKRVSQSLKSVGDRVEAGEAIGYAVVGAEQTGAEAAEAATAGMATGMAAGGQLPSGRLVFELWSDGQPIDPQRYIVF
jgi:murein DD-endopeptidase MepM/ murein hydrolase activator NlpD